MLSTSSQKKLRLAPSASEPNFREKAVPALKGVVTRDLGGSRAEIRLDEHQLASDPGISRTPVREALCPRFVRSVPRRASYVARKTRGEVIETIAPWAALKGMAVRLARHTTTVHEIAGQRRMFSSFENGAVDEHSEVNIKFHPYADDPPQTIGEMGRADRTIHDHTNIIEALRPHGTNRAEELVVSRASASPSMWGSIPIIWIE